MINKQKIVEESYVYKKKITLTDHSPIKYTTQITYSEQIDAVQVEEKNINNKLAFFGTKIIN